MSTIRALLFGLSAMGGTLFCLIFAASLINPGGVEKAGKELIRNHVEKKIQEKLETIGSGYPFSKAAAMVGKHGAAIAALESLRSARLPERIAVVIAEMQDPDCACRKQGETGLLSGFSWQTANAAQVQERLTALIRNRYRETAAQLTREFRIFTGSNALVFLLLGIAAWIKPRAGLHLLPAAGLLLAATALTGYFYLFKQNWLHTIVFNEYVGFAFFGYLGAVFALLWDIVLNRARVTSELLNGLFNAVGSALQVDPC